MKKRMLSKVVAIALTLLFSVSLLTVASSAKGVLGQVNQTLSTVNSVVDNSVKLATTPLRVANKVGNQVNRAIDNTEKLANSVTVVGDTVANVASAPARQVAQVEDATIHVVNSTETLVNMITG